MQHATARLVSVVVLLIASIISCFSFAGCDDTPPPGTPGLGSLILIVRTFPATTDPELAAIHHITIQTDHVEVIHAATADGPEDTVTVDTHPRLITLENAQGDTFVAQYPVPVGFVRQIRIFPKQISIGLKDGSAVELDRKPQTPSFDESGWKIVPPDDQGFVINDGALTGVRALFYFDKQVLFNHGIGYKLKPTIPSETFQVNPNDDAPGVFVDRIMISFNAGVTPTQVDAINAPINATVLKAPHITNTYIIKLSATENIQDAFHYYAARSEVAWLFPALNAPPLDLTPNEGAQDTQTLIHLPAAWQTVSNAHLGEVGSHKITVAVIDTGVDVAHPDIYKNIAINQGEIPPGLTVVDVDGDNVISFVDLNDSANDAVRPLDINHNRYVDGVDLINSSTWANGVDDDNDCTSAAAGSCVDDLVGWNVATWSNDVTPGNAEGSYHGTFVAGIVGALANNNLATAGTAWSVSIIPIRADRGAQATFSDADIMEAMTYASRRGANIANLSLGLTLWSDAADTSCADDLKTYSNTFKIPDADFQSVLVRDQNNFMKPDLVDTSGNVVTNTLFVFAAGNDRANLADSHVVQFPAGVAHTALGRHALAVGAVNTSGDFSDFSNYGGPVVELFAPGESWKSLVPFTSGTCAPGNDGDCTRSDDDGTSFAAPVTAGVGVLALTRFPALVGDPEGLHDRLVNTAGGSVDVDLSCGPEHNRPLLNASAAVSP